MLRSWVVALIIFEVLLSACASPPAEHPDIPTASVFDQTLQRHLTAYFARAESVPIQISYELLRNGPTITGIAYPKYYVWVTVQSGQQVLRVGAARVQAINKSFEVTNFVPAEYLVEHPGYAASIFPAALVTDIERRAQNAPHTPKRAA